MGENQHDFSSFTKVEEPWLGLYAGVRRPGQEYVGTGVVHCLPFFHVLFQGCGEFHTPYNFFCGALQKIN